MSSFFRRILSTIAAIVLAVSLSSPALAAHIMSQENLVVDEDLSDDAYISGGYVNIQGDVGGDLYIAGGLVNIDGDVEEDVVVTGGMVKINGSVGGDLRIIGGQAVINGSVGDDLMVAAGMVDVTNNATVLGDVNAGTGVLTIDGVVSGDIVGVMGLMLVNGTVGGNIEVTVEDSIKVAPYANIGGDLSYSALFETEIPEEAVAGTVSFQKFEKENIEKDLNNILYTQIVYSFLATILLAFLLSWLAPNALIRSAELARKESFKAFGAGLLTMIATLVGSLILFLTVVGIPLAIMGFAALLVLFYVGRVFAVVWMSSHFVKFNKKTKRSKLFGAMLIATLIFYFIGLIPYIGMVIDAIIFFIGVGALVLIKVESYKHLRSKKLL